METKKVKYICGFDVTDGHQKTNRYLRRKTIKKIVIKLYLEIKQALKIYSWVACGR